MAGALIIEGGLDDVPAIAQAREQIFVFQQISYDENGEIESIGVFGGGKWEDSERHTLVNGQLVPTLYLRPGEVQRWRLIHAGIREALHLQLEGHTLHEIALDGLSMGRISAWGLDQSIELYPGYRSDVLIKAAPLPRKAPSATYLLRDIASSGERMALRAGAPEDSSILARVVVRGEPVNMALPGDADVAVTKAHEDIKLGDLLTGVEQSVAFNIAKFYCDPDAPGEACVPCDQAGVPADSNQCSDEAPNKFMVNDRPFSENFQLTAKLGTVARWKVASASPSSGHPFHIHVNPFQVERQGPQGWETVWKDTMFIPKQSTLELLTRYRRFSGSFVIHCHILDHEDNGMMALVKIDP
ncbi:MAG: multicopper oxidase domain-containing protein [Gammaproteobacteria bacterium]|nr:multicopper oxidase domain-containing protein [Gammaproteobacteria bacterium]